MTPNEQALGTSGEELGKGRQDKKHTTCGLLNINELVCDSLM